MEFYRTYGQPNLPEDYTFKVFGLDVACEDNLQYSRALKNACIKNAGLKPKRPSYCPRCRLPNALFSTRVCYKAGIAGAWNMACLSCDGVHVPNQPGPTNAALQQIEAIRARDLEVYLERKANKAKQRAKARAKQCEEDSDAETAAVKGPTTPFGILNNAVQLLGAGKSTAAGGYKKPKAQRMDRVAVTYGHINYMKGLHAYAGRSDDGEEKPRTVELIYWAQDQEPLVEQVPVQFGHELFLYEFEYFKNMRGPCLFERYAFEASMWCDLPWQTSPIWVAPEDDVVFICAMGIRCRSFGQQLERYQRSHGLALSPALSICAKVNLPPARHQWLVVWGPHGGAPEIHLFDLSIAHALDDETRLTLPWAHLIADASFLLIWRETETGWAAVGAGVSSGVLEAPITLVAHPSAETLVGSGEAIAWLEEWRMRGGPRSRASSPTTSNVGPAKHRRHLAASGLPVRLASIHKADSGSSVDLFAPLPSGPHPIPSQRGKSSTMRETHAHKADLFAGPVVLNDSKAHPTARAHPIAVQQSGPSGGTVALTSQKPVPSRIPLDAHDNKTDPTTRPNPCAGHKGELRSGRIVLDTPKAGRSEGPFRLDDSKTDSIARPSPLAAHLSGVHACMADHVARPKPLAVRQDKRPATTVAPVASKASGRARPTSLAGHQEVPSAGPAAVAVQSGRACGQGKQPTAARVALIASNPHPTAHPTPLSAQKAGASARLAAVPLAVQQGSGAREQPRIPARGKRTSHVAKGPVQGDKRPASPSFGDEIEVLDAPAATKGIPSPSKKTRLLVGTDAEVKVIDGPHGSAVSPVGGSEHDLAAQMHTSNSPSRVLPDEDIVLIEHPSPKLKSAFADKARAHTTSARATNTPRASTAQPSASTSNRTQSTLEDSSDDDVEFVEGPSSLAVSIGSSDDEVEIVEGSSIISKRRVSIINGREVIDMT